jgi:hypothetical protein
MCFSKRSVELTERLWMAQEINYFLNPHLITTTPVNFGWPCFEGSLPNPDYQAIAGSVISHKTALTRPQA